MKCLLPVLIQTLEADTVWLPPGLVSQVKSPELVMECAGRTFTERETKREKMNMESVTMTTDMTNGLMVYKMV